MASGIWTSVSGAAAQSQSVDAIANNLANSDTVGFKKDQPTFKEYLSSAEREHDGAALNPGPIRNRDLYPLDGRDQSFVIVNGTYTNFRPGAIRVTQGPLDVALDGPGFLEVSTPAGIRYTRAGNLKMAADGKLVTADGNPVLSAQPQGLAAAATGGAPDAAARFISLRDRSPNLTINGAGEIHAGDQLVARMSVVEFQDHNKLRKAGASMFTSADPRNISTEPSHTLLRQGMIELSNVNPVEEMTKLIQANRLFEQDLKALKTYGEILGKEANDIGETLMINALTTAATGLEAQQANVERISNDLANVNTDGYKRSRTEFQDLMYETIKEAGGSLGAGSQSPVGIQVGHGVKVGASHKIFEQGPTHTTGNMYDMMVEGRGFFTVQAPNGEIAYTRNGAFHLDSQGRLTLANGCMLMPQITVPVNATGVTVSPQGEVRATLSTGAEQGLGNIQLATFINEEGLSAIGGNLFKSTLGSGAPIQSVPGENGTGMLAQHALEGANVNVANSMVDLLSAQRAYEMGTKVMGAVDQMWSATINVK